MQHKHSNNTEIICLELSIGPHTMSLVKYFNENVQCMQHYVSFHRLLAIVRM